MREHIDPQLSREAAAQVRKENEKPTRSADVLANILVQAGVELVFDLPGGAISPLCDALVDHPEIRVVTTRHEAGAMFSACGYAHSTGKLAVVMVTSGPGVLNAMTGLASAHLDGLPVLLIAGEVPRARFGKNALQEGSSEGLDIVAMARPVTKLAAQVTDPHSAPSLLRRAIATALSGKKGPVLLTLPVDVATAPIRAPLLGLEPQVELTIDKSVLAATARILEAARRPLLFVGAGARWDHGPERVRALAERLQLPVMTTPKGKGIFPEDHPLALGVFGFGSHPSTSEYLKEGIDTLLVVGSSLGEAATSAWSPLLAPSEHFIQIDTEARHLGRSYPVTVGIVGAADPVLAGLIDQLGPGVRPKRTLGIVRHERGDERLVGSEGRISPQRALWELQQLMPADTIYSCDIGEHMLFSIHHLEINDPHGFVLQLGLGSMASGLGAAAGIKLARPERPVVAVCGDGCFSMGLGDVATAVREQIPFLVFVLNDQRFGMVEIGNGAVYGRTPPYPAGAMSVSGLAQSVGARAVTIDRPDQLASIDLAGLLKRGPLVVDVQIDRTVRMPNNARFDFLSKATQAQLVN